MRLKKKDGCFAFKGYSSLRQLGRFYALTTDKRITRLFTSVAFLDPCNLHFIAYDLGKQGLAKISIRSNN
jgi:hypothetical protein